MLYVHSEINYFLFFELFSPYFWLVGVVGYSRNDWIVCAQIHLLLPCVNFQHIFMIVVQCCAGVYNYYILLWCIRKKLKTNTTCVIGVHWFYEYEFWKLTHTQSWFTQDSHSTYTMRYFSIIVLRTCGTSFTSFYLYAIMVFPNGFHVQFLFKVMSYALWCGKCHIFCYIVVWVDLHVLKHQWLAIVFFWMCVCVCFVCNVLVGH